MFIMPNYPPRRVSYADLQITQLFLICEMVTQPKHMQIKITWLIMFIIIFLFDIFLIWLYVSPYLEAPISIPLTDPAHDINTAIDMIQDTEPIV